ncbi:NAD(P)/FAD-dependent oxidoreductase [Micromonospora sp. STR1_7]|uniref:NAD(P)/FAD-dependent oxidoreductase n=1 Tax=Micromonospora parastrephiae TaxID=2806101 RepID=A0ABS1XTJ0_9ACTN|nr:NAD(P)/FAD-dependent oxidoreductase [Micromonospora parastrephiae]
MQGTRPSRHTVIVVGAGFAGLAVGIQLKRRGIDSFLILDKGDDLGGTWRDNVYPGASCDIPSHLYSYSFAPYRDASVRYPAQPQILDYLRSCADRYGVRAHLRTGVEIESASYDDSTCTWSLSATDGTRFEADVAVFALGQLHLPNVPTIAGQDQFSGARSTRRSGTSGWTSPGNGSRSSGTGRARRRSCPASSTRWPSSTCSTGPPRTSCRSPRRSSGRRYGPRYACCPGCTRLTGRCCSGAPSWSSSRRCGGTGSPGCSPPRPGSTCTTRWATRPCAKS